MAKLEGIKGDDEVTFEGIEGDDETAAGAAVPVCCSSRNRSREGRPSDNGDVTTTGDDANKTRVPGSCGSPNFSRDVVTDEALHTPDCTAAMSADLRSTRLPLGCLTPTSRGEFGADMLGGEALKSTSLLRW